MSAKVTSRQRWTLLLSTPLLGGVLATACASVFGIEERTYDGPTEGSALCQTYCSEALSVCKGADALYASSETCLGTCKHFKPGAQGDEHGNTIECRRTQLKLARETGEISDYCSRAGPGGDGTCGTNCEGYCTLMLPVCGPGWFQDMPSCLNACSQVPDQHDYSINHQYENTIQCRLYHVTSATQDSMHCAHAGGAAKCVAQDAGGAD